MNQRLRPSDEHHQHSGHLNDQDPFTSDEPSWFLKQAHREPQEELVSRYRLSRNIPERPNHHDNHRRPDYRDSAPARPRPPARFIESRDSDPPRHKRHYARQGLSVKHTFLLAAIMAVVSGGTVGYLSSQYSTLKSSALALFNDAAATSVPEVQAESVQPQLQTVAATIVPKKPVATATLQVNDVTGQTNSLIPLALTAEPALADQDLIMKISGLPENAYLTSGTRDADKIWALSLDELKNVKLMIPQAEHPQIDVAVAAFERKTGELAAPVKTMTIALSDVVVQPVSAPPLAQAAQPVLSTEPKTGLPGAIPQPATVNLAMTAAQHVAAQHAVRGNSLLESGDIAGARKSYQQAWTGGSPEGALGMARSYDPVVLAGLKVKGSEPNSSLALEWYQKAATAGKTEALSAIVRLRMKPE